MKELSAKDDSSLKKTVIEMREWRRARGIPEPESDLAATIAWWKAMRASPAEGGHRILVLVGPAAEAEYQAFFPRIRARGKTPDEAKARLAKALRHYIDNAMARGEIVDTIEIPLYVLVPPVPAQAVREESEGYETENEHVG
ncbi:MAG: hypothetical protein QHJ81_08305 [Anaerolineae bacterium]|nr:hypothetical protein [Anaerolineae bacterium]